MIIWDCPCRQCERTVINASWTTTSNWNFQVCEPECNSWGGWWGWEWWWEWWWSWNSIDPPEIPGGNEQSPITPWECISCPCNYADFESSLNINDRIKAILLDDSISVIYSQTTPTYLKEFLE